MDSVGDPVPSATATAEILSEIHRMAVQGQQDVDADGKSMPAASRSRGGSRTPNRPRGASGAGGRPESEDAVEDFLGSVAATSSGHEAAGGEKEEASEDEDEAEVRRLEAMIEAL